MTTDQIADALRPHFGTLREIGLCSLSLFGSAARGEARLDSDLDFLYEFVPGAATLQHRLTLERVLEDALGRPVDLVPRKHLGAILPRYIGDDVATVYRRDLEAA